MAFLTDNQANVHIVPVIGASVQVGTQYQSAAISTQARLYWTAYACLVNDRFTFESCRCSHSALNDGSGSCAAIRATLSPIALADCI